MRISTALVPAGIAYLLAMPALAQETRQLGPHVHGESHLTIAAEGRSLQMELHAPGVDIVGFEYAPTTNAQRAAIAAATATLGDPIGLFGIPATAECAVGKVQVSLVEEDEDEDAHAAGASPAAAPAQKPAAPAATAAAPAKPATPAAPGAPAAPMHTEFQVAYALTCSNLPAIAGLNFVFFSKFKNAMSVNVELVSAKGAFSFAVPRAKPAVATRNMF
jgi:hypothetical protein